MLAEIDDDDTDIDPATYANDDVKSLTQAWVNERCAPEVLPYEDGLMTNLMEMLEVQSANVDTLRDGRADAAFLQVLYQQEMERIKFVMRSYLRARLAKIEEHVMHYLQEAEHRRKLSPKELVFAERYDELIRKHHLKSSLESLPPALQRLDEGGDISMITTPDLDDAVFCRVIQDVGDFQIDDRGNSVSMERDNVYILRYRAIRTLLAQSRVQLL
ncbi:hypothetical protein SmJEL517_g05305 [Synchytrium microbalum]|uniref:DNA replication complex GINS protein SLD5 n=1 Tax=Synchytrium microbalum TaxID=1806994 RepID=A0A507BZX2_9FUNG|nr:uncharacterized protein SmJEL517_g05305 [Synchytrium microbalum]TPX31344.1 hypothetical protein SmJEL517_g05305 [Synchytrium microbalum]